ncbi:hypothetical protein ZYGM_003556 [Zygosaccharomyces mellis]|uniref:Uncharacterized protein n=1 Tax=Zygosaccharomyces mellis TaxID=42258 RepID=A0A4C2E1Y5_9SACH|nr:hypothetical protein ZYGM_003556 [Zygosaccharomyces mellis]
MPQDSIKSNLKLNSSAHMKFAALSEKEVNNAKQQLSPTINVTVSPRPSESSKETAAKPLSLKEQIKTLGPINEIPNEKVKKLADSIKGPFTESEVQELLLSYTYTSGMVDGGCLSSAVVGKRRAQLNSKIRKIWTFVALKAVDSIDKLQSKLYEYFWLCAIYLNVWFPKLTSFFSEVFGENSGLSSFTENYVLPSCQRSAGLIKSGLIKLVTRFQKKPYSTAFISIVATINFVPILIFVIIMATLSSVYFLIYFVSFLAIAAAASFFIIPLLGVSFLFASAVVAFGFFSDITFKFAQALYIKTDHRLKSTLNKMGSQRNSSANSQPEDSPQVPLHSEVEQQLEPNANA